MTEQELSEIELVIGYTFRNRTLLRQAFTRRSYTHEMGQSGTPADTESNEVLEFIGDSVLGAALVMILSRRYGSLGERGLETEFEEGDFTRIKSNLSDKRALAGIVTRLGFADRMRVSHGDEINRVTDNDSPKEDLFESIIAAVALDCNMDFSVIVPLVERLDRPDRLISHVKGEKDPKSTLKELCEQSGKTCTYDPPEREGPDHAPFYTVWCRIDGETVAKGTGSRKQLAEMAAAAAALGKLSANGN